MPSLAEQLRARRAGLSATTTSVRRVDGSTELYRGGELVETSTVAQGLGYGFVADTRPDLELALILPNLYLGSQDVPVTQPEKLRALGITRVLNVAEGVRYDLGAPGGDLGEIVVAAVPMLDLPEVDILAPAAPPSAPSSPPPLPAGFPDESVLAPSCLLGRAVSLVRQWAHGEGRRVLVHCNAGVSRSSAVVIAYLMLYHREQFHGSYEESFHHCRQLRPCVRPNEGFVKQLKALEGRMATEGARGHEPCGGGAPGGSRAGAESPGRARV